MIEETRTDEVTGTKMATFMRVHNHFVVEVWDLHVN